MPIDKEAVKKALDQFENDDYVGAKETLEPEIKKAKEEFLQKKLDLKNPISPKKNDTDDNKKED